MARKIHIEFIFLSELSTPYLKSWLAIRPTLVPPTDHKIHQDFLFVQSNGVTDFCCFVFFSFLIFEFFLIFFFFCFFVFVFLFFCFFGLSKCANNKNHNFSIAIFWRINDDAICQPFWDAVFGCRSLWSTHLP